MALRIEDYALIGDCQTAALVGKDGSIDWLCCPRFDAGACFAALLGTVEDGRWRICPAGGVSEVRRRYRDGTLVLETDFHTEDGGIVSLIDFMHLRSGTPDVVRVVRGVRGTTRMLMDLTIRFDYGNIVPWVRHIERGIRAIAGPETLYCRADVEMRGEDHHTVADFEVAEGQTVSFALSWSPTYGEQPAEIDALSALQETEEWWRAWSARCTYTGKHREAVVRSLITLKGLTYAPTGGVVAAPTTSLPEHIGGVRNWDYRYCWLRDATFTLYALMVGGYIEEAHAWREWLIHSVAGTPSDLQIMYGIAGERRLTEMELPWLAGYVGSKPVRIGNGAAHQHQLDVYGEVMDCLHVARRMGLPPSDDAWRVQRAIVRFLETDWQKPDEGIWEVRGPRRHFTHSKMMAWVALDRAVYAVEQHGANGDLEPWRLLRDRIHDEVCREGFNPAVNGFTQFYGSNHADASLLMMPLVGFLPPDDPRVRGTVALIERDLLVDGYVKRYRPDEQIEGLPGDEGAFLLCTFWLADNYALMGRLGEANELFQRLLALRNDVGLLSEEYDPKAKRLLGNFPQAFSHIGLINTASNLSRQDGPAHDRPHHE